MTKKVGMFLIGFVAVAMIHVLFGAPHGAGAQDTGPAPTIPRGDRDLDGLDGGSFHIRRHPGGSRYGNVSGQSNYASSGVWWHT